MNKQERLEKFCDGVAYGMSDSALEIGLLRMALENGSQRYPELEGQFFSQCIRHGIIEYERE